MREIFLIGGAGENPSNPGFLDSFLHRYIKSTDVVRRIRYPAAIGPVNITKNPLDFTNSALQSREACADEIARQVAKTDQVPILAGYSLGAWGLSLFLERMAAGKYRNQNGSPLQLAGVLFVANPRRRKQDGIASFGIAGEGGPYPPGVKYIDIANRNDGIPLCPPTSALRTLPYIGDVLTTNQDQKTLNAWAQLALLNLFKYDYSTAALGRDVYLLSKYLDRTGHEKEYFTEEHISKAKPIFS